MVVSGDSCHLSSVRQSLKLGAPSTASYIVSEWCRQGLTQGRWPASLHERGSIAAEQKVHCLDVKQQSTLPVSETNCQSGNANVNSRVLGMWELPGIGLAPAPFALFWGAKCALP